MADFLTHTLGASVRIVYGNSVADWLVAGIVAVAVWSGLSLLRRLVAARSKRYRRRPAFGAGPAGLPSPQQHQAISVSGARPVRRPGGPDVSAEAGASRLEFRADADPAAGRPVGGAIRALLSADQGGGARAPTGCSRDRWTSSTSSRGMLDLVAVDPGGAGESRRQHHRAARGVGRRRRRGGAGPAEHSRRFVRLAVDRAR